MMFAFSVYVSQSMCPAHSVYSRESAVCKRDYERQGCVFDLMNYGTKEKKKEKKVFIYNN